MLTPANNKWHKRTIVGDREAKPPKLKLAHILLPAPQFK